MIVFIPSNVHQGHYVHIDGKKTDIVVNLYAYRTIKKYKAKVDKEIEQYKN